MPRVCYVSKSFHPRRASVIADANTIIDEYAKQGYILTLRQLYYQFVARGLIENTKREYDNLGSTINDARLAGLIDWEAIEDRTRKLQTRSKWDDPADAIESIAKQYHIDLWEGQDVYVQVWVEKEALAGVIQRASEPYDVSWYCTRGYNSQSEAWRAAMNFKWHYHHGRRGKVIHLGDHDPSGIDMTRDIQERFYQFGVYGVDVIRVALNMDQVEEYNPPPFFAKVSDTRYDGYVEKYGEESWELDALEPSVLGELISNTVDGFINMNLWNERQEQEEKEREQLTRVASNWDDVLQHVNEYEWDDHGEEE